MEYSVTVIGGANCYYCQLDTNKKLKIGSGTFDDCHFPELKPSQYSLFLDGSRIIVQQGLFNKHELRKEEIVTLEGHEKILIYIRSVQSKSPVRIDLKTDHEIIFGRSNQADFRINNRYFSRAHFSIRKDHGLLKVKDLGSSYGTFIDDNRIREAVIASGESIVVLSMKFEFHDDYMNIFGLYDDYENNIKDKSILEQYAYQEMPRPQNMDLGLERIKNHNMRLKGFGNNIVLLYENSDYSAFQMIRSFEMQDGLLTPRHFLFNGKHAFFFRTDQLFTIEQVLPRITSEELLKLYISFFVKFNLFIKDEVIEEQHIVMKSSLIFVDILTLEIWFVYADFLESVPVTREEYCLALRYEMADYMEKITLVDTIGVELKREMKEALMNASIPMDEIPNVLNGIQEYHLSDHEREAERSLFERMTSGTMYLEKNLETI